MSKKKMEDTDEKEAWFRCEMCGFEYSEEEAKGACASCPVSHCERLKCPNCGYESFPEPRLVKIIKGWSRDKVSKGEEGDG